MLVIAFEGWFQCRLATNPDPSDEPRGVSGYTFAVAGEPDLDRIIRFHDPMAARSHGPRVGVNVTSVTVDGEDVHDHVLSGARVELLGLPKFESRNSLLTKDRGGVGIIHPFHIQISAGGVTLSREDVPYPEDPNLALHLVPPSRLASRAPVLLEGLLQDPMRIADATGITDPIAFRDRRRALLETDLADTSDPMARAALEKRIRELAMNAPRNIRVTSVTAVQMRKFTIDGPARIADDGDLLGPQFSDGLGWPLEFWMGGWDADALCGYVRGTLKVS